MTRPTVSAIHVGEPRELHDARGRSYTSAIAKRRVDGPVRIGPDNLAGDRQADLRHHGGPDKAVCAYPTAHLSYWREQLAQTDLQEGAFGENLSLADTNETDVAIGDTFQVGDAVLQVSQPRSPCWKLARRWNAPNLAVRVQDTGYTGWYLRVLIPGEVAPGQQLALVDRPHTELTIAETNRARWHAPHDLGTAAQLAECPELADTWRAHFRARMNDQPERNHGARLPVTGP